MRHNGDRDLLPTVGSPGDLDATVEPDSDERRGTNDQRDDCAGGAPSTPDALTDVPHCHHDSPSSQLPLWRGPRRPVVGGTLSGE